MKTLEDYKKGILLVLEMLQEHNPEIGNYEECIINEKGGFTVFLDDNHKIDIGKFYAEDFQNGYTDISDEDIRRTLATYRPI